MDLEPLIPWLKKYKINPVTGKPLEFKQLIKLNFHKNEGKMECPVLFKQFTNSSHIAAIATSGNVYLMEAIEQLNIKNKNWKDLITDQPFERSDIIVLQDPNNLEKFNISNFHHVKKDLKVETEEQIQERKNSKVRLKNINPETKYALEELERDYKETSTDSKQVVSKDKADKFNAAHFSTGAVAASFTSTAMAPELVHEMAILPENEVRYQYVKKKGYVRLITNFGPLNLELHCDMVPKTCENFIKHCQNGYYNGTKFHRSIRNFMIQGGDPTNTGNGGQSIWGEPFEDEIRPNLSHTGRGILSMANSGKNTNGSQFFITYRSCKHLDKKHTIFGCVVGGVETLTEMERIEVDNKDRPIEDIVLVRAQVFKDPFEEADEQLMKMREEENARILSEEAEKTKNSKPKKVLEAYRSGVGKFINPAIGKSSNSKSGVLQEPQPKKAKLCRGFVFDKW